MDGFSVYGTESAYFNQEKIYHSLHLHLPMPIKFSGAFPLQLNNNHYLGIFPNFLTLITVYNNNKTKHFCIFHLI